MPMKEQNSPLSFGQRKRICLGIMALCLAAFALWAWILPHPKDPLICTLTEGAVLRTVAAVMLAALLWFFGTPLWRLKNSPFARPPRRLTRKHPRTALLWILLPGLLVCINNTPILALLDGRALLLRPDLLPLWVWSCLGIACFEEFAFRGILLPFLLEKTKGRPRCLWIGVLASSGIFALTHLLNLLEGASPGGVLLQVGYSFLIGAMCSVILLATGSVFYCVLLHFIYDFGGLLIPHLGRFSASPWDTVTVLLTVLLTLIALGWYVVILKESGVQNEA